MSDTPDPAELKGFNAKVIEEFRTNGGKVGGPFEGADLLLLTTTGAKSGQPRVSPLAYQRVDGKMLIIGSYRGADVDPSWVHNLRANPQAHVEVGTDSYDVVTRELPPRGARPSVGRDRRGRAGIRRIPVEHQPRHPALRTHAGLIAPRR